MGIRRRDELVGRARRGDRKALEELFEKNMDTVYGFIAVKVGPNDAEIEDLVQETFVGAMGSVNRLRGDDEVAFAGWLLSIARYKVADHYRKRYASRVEHLEDAPRGELADSVVSAEDIVAQETENEALREALSGLSPDQEEVLTLKFILGYDTQQVAAITRRRAGAVRALQHRGLATLRRQLGREMEKWN